MDRRGLFGLALGLIPALAAAQAVPPVPAPPARERPKLTTLSFDEMTPRQRRKVQQRLAGTGNPPMPPEEARRAWDGMNPRQRREATRQQEGGSGRQQQTMRPPQ